MEGSKALLALLLVAGVLMGMMDSSGAYIFYAGGRDGWVTNPSESYRDWAGRNRFQVNDTIVFRYKEGQDSVLVVTKQDYDACNVSNPIQRLDGGDSAFKFDRSGPFFFISGVVGNCKKGQKLVVVVMAVRQWTPISSPPSSLPSKPPVSSPPPTPPSLPPSPSPASGGRALSPAPKPSARPPVSAPSTPGSPPPASSGGASSDGGSSPAPAPGEPTSSSPALNASKLWLGMVMLMILGGAFLA